VTGAATRGAGRWRRAALWLALAALLAVGLTRGLWTPDEPREAEIGREMYLAPGVIPTLNGAAFVEKPPLYYWALAGAYAATGGPSAAAARAVSGLAALLTLAVLFLWLRRAVSERAGWIAVLLLATSSQFALSTHWVLLDPLLMLWTTLAAWAFWERIVRSSPAAGTIPGADHGARFLLLGYASLALAAWTKGLVGPVLVVAGLAVHGLVEERRRPWRAWRAWRPVWLAGFGLLVVASLGLALGAGGGWRAVSTWAWQNHVQRFLDPQGTGHSHAPHYYFVNLPVAVLPWIVPFAALFVPGFWRRLGARLPVARYAAALVGGGFLVLTASATKRETYLLPLLPPLFLLVALACEEWLDRRSGDAPAGPAAWAQAALLALLAPAPAVATMVYLGEFRPGAVAAALVGAGVAVTLLRAAARRRTRAALALGVVAAAVFVVTALAVAAPALEPRKSFAPFLAWADRELPAGAPVYACGADETLLGIVPFRTGRPVVEVGDEHRCEPERGTAGPAFVLLQVKGKGAGRPGPIDGYDLLRVDEIGSGRTFSLWRRHPDEPGGSE
jgi:4-amino-4-deoxy-L-arabinose transferase-like glycosyltransferase